MARGSEFLLASMSMLLLWETKVIELSKEFQVVVFRLDFDLLHEVMSWPEVWRSRTRSELKKYFQASWVPELVPRPLSSPGTGSKVSIEPLVWKKTTYLKVWTPHTKDGGPLGIRDVPMMSFGVDELCKRVSQKTQTCRTATGDIIFDCSSWNSWWSKLNLSLYCQISPIKPLLHLDPNVWIKWQWTGYIFVCYSSVLSGSGNWNEEFHFLYQDPEFFCIELSLHEGN